MAKKPKKIKPSKPNRQLGEKGKKIEGRFATRDINSGAVVYNDNAGYQKAKKRKRAGKDMLAQRNAVAQQGLKIDDLQKKLETQEWQLNQILKKLDELK